MRDVNRIATQIITPNAGAVLSRDKVKQYLRLDSSADDSLIDDMIAQVVNITQRNIRRFLLPTTVNVVLDQFPQGADY